jgi:hypothetical protein
VTSPHPVALSATATLDQRRVRHGTVDTDTQLHVCKGADVVFPVTTIEGKRYAIFMRNQTLVVDKETETLLSVAVLLKAGFDVKFVTGTKRDPTFGGYLVTPDGQKIRMIFGDNLWHLPMWSDPVRYTNDQTSPTNRNTLALVPTAAALEALAQPFSSRPRSHASCPQHVVPPWQRQNGANLQGEAGERLPERLHHSASQISLCHLRGVGAHTTLSTFQARQSGRRQASDASSHVANTQTNR